MIMYNIFFCFIFDYMHYFCCITELDGEGGDKKLLKLCYVINVQLLTTAYKKQKKFSFIEKQIVILIPTLLCFDMCTIGRPAHIKLIICFNPGALEDTRHDRINNLCSIV